MIFTGNPNSNSSALRFDLPQWVALLGFAAVVAIGVVFASVLSHFVTQAILENDAALTGQFVTSIVDGHQSFAEPGTESMLVTVADEGGSMRSANADFRRAKSASRVYAQLGLLPDVLLAQVITRDRKVVWSTNPSWVGSSKVRNSIVDEAFSSHGGGTLFHASERAEAGALDQFGREGARLYVDNYIPLADGSGKVAAVARLYKEPRNLQRTISRGTQLVWACTALSALALYLSFFLIVRRADASLKDHRRRLAEAEALCAIGEMSAAVAHGIRNPLSSIRSSAELALDSDPGRARKSATDIMVQVDRLGQWVRDLLEFSRPLAGENGSIHLPALAEECLQAFSCQVERRGIACEFVRPKTGLPSVTANGALAGQALASIISNAIESMPDGGTLKLEFDASLLPHSVGLIVTDTGYGIEPAGMDLVFKPYYTTKQNGLGLGMALAKRIMQRFGGGITLRSRPGEGTQVVLIFGVSGIWPNPS